MGNSYQDMILNHVRKENISVTIYLTNGFQIRGVVKGFDNYVIVLESEGKQQMIYKHAASTVIPAKSLSGIFDEDKKTEEAEKNNDQ
ncbi:MAG: RNA chaperone Hfq [Defluviitaleaceae bacterium]|nr:RNA chaperone Hfq [Defluviitaleaceae bacterium]